MLSASKCFSFETLAYITTQASQVCDYLRIGASVKGNSEISEVIGVSQCLVIHIMGDTQFHLGGCHSIHRAQARGL